MKKYIFFLLAFIPFFTACSTKEVYKPKKVAEEWKKTSSMDESIVDTSNNVALLENRKVLTRNGELNITIAPDHRLIALSDEKVISASIDGNLTIQSIKNATLQHFELKKTIAAASISGNILAVLFANDDIALYDTDTKEILFKEQGGKAIANDMRIVNPFFFNDLVIFSTLDGKVVVVNAKLKKRLRTVIVSSNDYFNNIIYFNIADNKILAATSYKMLSMAQKELRQKYEIRNILFDGKLIYITTKQGEIIALTPDLQVDSKIKLPFAHFLGMIDHKGKLYILEKEGYMIVVDKKSFAYTVHEVDIDDGFVFVGKDLFYVDDEKISLE
ncbi:Putative lipoprotein [hydrothermal vent metagenome]|uniref:Putative lipoprotein n=1 Tax=hydrothermal vent metagenome TaxID=652676 RepID=A0A1W1BDX2_9ZZZZ